MTARNLRCGSAYILSYLFEIRKYSGAIDFEKEVMHRTAGLEEFQKNQYVQLLISKVGSEKTWEQWVRRDYNYVKWLKENGFFGSVTELILDYKKITDQDRRNRLFGI